MKPIWFFVGLLLTALGLIIIAVGVYYIFNPGLNRTVLAGLHPNLWWGGIMLIAGILFIMTNKNKVIR
ncbi:MAG: hypothetical protein ACM3UR_06115 [Bacteroidota bacterium]|jgi:uncharacterized membrane protein HdeD (DUF308 family)|nr:hypothetical protein [Ignavibacteria bacterium]MCU7498399.1 hypothetical protein [Ignavibacteria bacterium]MCU7511941.1 hypothetical protein [Ignavibacteria bacterium]MCU7520026.1 hypothetical protein [Ignavibacteria bacterium]MCU7523100.1 hypothetical protein [Ignavibacteria bacterium]